MYSGLIVTFWPLTKHNSNYKDPTQNIIRPLIRSEPKGNCIFNLIPQKISKKKLRNFR